MGSQLGHVRCGRDAMVAAAEGEEERDGEGVRCGVPSSPPCSQSVLLCSRCCVEAAVLWQLFILSSSCREVRCPRALPPLPTHHLTFPFLIVSSPSLSSFLFSSPFISYNPSFPSCPFPSPYLPPLLPSLSFLLPSVHLFLVPFPHSPPSLLLNSLCPAPCLLNRLQSPSLLLTPFYLLLLPSLFPNASSESPLHPCSSI